MSSNSNLKNIGGYALAIVGVILAAYVGVQVISSLLPTYASGISSISENFTTADWGDATANSLGPVLALVISLVGMFGLAGVVFYAVSLRGGKGT